MLKSFNPILNEVPTVFNEDVYLFSESGRVISCRVGKSEKPNNIFALLSATEERFVRENILFSDIRLLLLVASSRGLILIDRSLLGHFRVMVAIIPHLSDDELLSLIKEDLISRVHLSDSTCCLLESLLE